MALPPPIPLVLSVKSASWRMNDPHSHESDSEFQNVRMRVLERDNRTCRFCGFKTQKWQEVHHLDDNHANNDMKNLVTACMFCHMCQHIGLAGHNKEAVLIWLPEIPQAHLHHIVRSLMVANRWADTNSTRKEPPAIVSGIKRMAEAATSVQASLQGREAEAVRIFGTSDPTVLANVMLDQPDILYAKRGEFLKGLRLLPLGKRVQNGIEKMPEIIDNWISNGGYTNLHPRTWWTLYKQFGMERSE